MNFAYLLLIIYGTQASLQRFLDKSFYVRRVDNEIRQCTKSILLSLTKRHKLTRYYTSEVKQTFPYSTEIDSYLKRRNYPLLYSSIGYLKDKEKEYLNADLCLVEAANEKELRLAMSMLYEHAYHDNCIISLMFESNEGENLKKLAKEVWAQGYPMNIRFLLFSKQTNSTWIIGPASYSEETCKEGKLVKFGHCSLRERKLEHQTLFTPTTHLGGCTVTALVHPPFLPYVRAKTTNKTSNPGGIFGKLLPEVAKLMNFTLAYEWKVGRSDVLSFTKKHNLHLLLDMLPHMQTINHKYRFTISPVSRSFVMPPIRPVFTLTELMNPFDKGTWFCMFLIFLFLTIACIMDYKADTAKLLLQTFGIFLGVGVGDLESRKWFRYFLWAWLLPAYVLVQAYLAIITENLSVLPPVQGFKTVHELSMSNVKMYCDEESIILACSLGKQTNDVCQNCRNISDEELYNKIWPSFLQSKMLNNSAFVFNTNMRFAYANVFNDLAVIPEETQLNQIVSVRPGNDYIFELERIFKTFQENGLMKFFLHMFGKSNTKFEAKTSYGLGIQLLYTIVSYGWALSLLVFVLEMIVHRLSRR